MYTNAAFTSWTDPTTCILTHTETVGVHSLLNVLLLCCCWPRYHLKRYIQVLLLFFALLKLPIRCICKQYGIEGNVVAIALLCLHVIVLVCVCVCVCVCKWIFNLFIICNFSKASSELCYAHWHSIWFWDSWTPWALPIK